MAAHNQHCHARERAHDLVDVDQIIKVAFAVGSVTGCFPLVILCPVTLIPAVAKPRGRGVTSVLKHYAALL